MITDVEVRDAGLKGRGVFALRPFAPGEFVFRRCHARVVAASGLDDLAGWERAHLCELGFDRLRRSSASGLLPEPRLRPQCDAPRRQGLRLAPNRSRRGGHH